MSTQFVSIDQPKSVSDLFQSTLRQAQLTGLAERLLLRYETLPDFNHLNSVKSKSRKYLGTQMVPVERIIGGVDTKGDYDRQFRPLREQLRDCWEDTFRLMQTDQLEPVTLYKVWNSYYVADGHPQVSVAHASGKQFIKAVVWEYGTGKASSQGKAVQMPARQTGVPSLSQGCGCD